MQLWNHSLRGRLKQLQGDAVWVGEINGVTTLIHPGFNRDRLLGFEILISFNPLCPLVLCAEGFALVVVPLLFALVQTFAVAFLWPVAYCLLPAVLRYAACLPCCATSDLPCGRSSRVLVSLLLR